LLIHLGHSADPDDAFMWWGLASGIVDTRGFVVRDATVFVGSTPRVTTGNRLQPATDGWATFQLQPLSTFPAKRGAVQFFVKAYRPGDPVLAGVAGYRLVQVIIRPQ